MLGSPILYLKGMRAIMFQLSGFYCRLQTLERRLLKILGVFLVHSDLDEPGRDCCDGPPSLTPHQPYLLNRKARPNRKRHNFCFCRQANLIHLPALTPVIKAKPDISMVNQQTPPLYSIIPKGCYTDYAPKDFHPMCLCTPLTAAPKSTQTRIRIRLGYPVKNSVLK